jgi:hypothetical protein
MGLSGRGSGALGRFATEGPIALVEYARSMPAASLALLSYSAIFMAAVYAVLAVGVATFAFRRSAVRDLVRDGTYGRWLLLVLAVSVYFIGIQAGPEALGRFRIPLLPLWHSIVLVTLAVLTHARPATRTAAATTTRGEVQCTY